MNLILSELKQALDKQCYLSALTLALTIPDMCGQIEYPSITGKGSVGKRYSKWFDQYVKKYFITDNIVFFTGKDCYALRNSILHSGQSNASKRIQMFRLAMPDGPIPVQRRCNYSSNTQKDIRISIDIQQLCWCLGMGMTDWITETTKDTDMLNLLTFFSPDEFYDRNNH